MRTLKFEELNLSENVVSGLDNINRANASTFQQSMLSHVLDKKNVLIKEADGADKTTGIAVAALEILNRAESRDEICVLILAAKPQTARDIHNQIADISSSGDLSVCVDDDGNKAQQAEGIDARTAIIVANPGRLQDLLQEHRFIFRNLDLLVLDEMHLMVKNDSGHLKQIKRRILSEPTTLICSKTYTNSEKKISATFADELSVIGFNDGSSGAPPPVRASLQQNYIKVPSRMKISTLTAHIEHTATNNSVIFTASKRGTDRLYRVLKKRGMKATSLHHKLSDEKRAQRFANFTNGDVQYLLVSDISAADLDLSNIAQVINYDVPDSSNEYRFRAALTSDDKNARIVSLVSKQDQDDINLLQNELGEIPEEIPLPEKAKQKLQERKRKQSNGQKKGRDRQKKDDEMQLPRPSYDKLSGGRSGNYDEEETGIVKFFKKLFS